MSLNDNTRFGKNKNLYYNLHSDYNFYIQISDKIIVQQKCERFLKQFIPLIYDDFKKNIMDDNEKLIKIITKETKIECSASKTIRMNKKWNKDYKKQKYKFMTRENIYKSVCKLIK